MATSGTTKRQGNRSGSNNRKKNTGSNSRSRQTTNRKASAGEEAFSDKLVQEILLIAVFAFCVFLFLCNFGIMGSVGVFMKNVQFGIFGLPAYIAPFLIFAAVLFYISNEGSPAAIRKLVSGMILFVLIEMLCELIAGRLSEMENYSFVTLYKSAAEHHNGGGVLAGSLAYLSRHYLSTFGTVLLVIVLGLICVVLLTEHSVINGAKKSSRLLAQKVRSREARYVEDYEDGEEEESAAERRERLREEKRERMLMRQKEQEERDRKRQEELEERNKRRLAEQEELDKKRQAELEERARRRQEEAEERARRNRKKQEEAEEKARRKQRQQEEREREKRLIQEEKEDEKILRMNKKSRGVMLDTTLVAKEEPVEARNDMHEIRIQDVVPGEPVYEEPKEQPIPSVYRTEAEDDEVQEISYPLYGETEYEEGQDYIQNEHSIQNINYDGEMEEIAAWPDSVLDSDRRYAIPGSEVTWRDGETPDFSFDRREFQAGEREYSVGGSAVQAEKEREFFVEEFRTGEQRDSAEEVVRAEEQKDSAEEVFWTGEQRDSAEETFRAGEQENSAEEDFRPGEQEIFDAEGKRPSNEYAFSLKEKELQKMPEPITEFSPGGASAVEKSGTQGNAGVKQDNVSIKLNEKGLPKKQLFATKKYMFPPVTLLRKGKNSGKGDNNKELKDTALHLQQTLETFGVKVTVTEISQGPTVTRFEIQPEQGVKVSKIVGLSDDIKLNLAATDIRIEAPIPGKAAVGIEVPNKENSVVAFRDLIESSEYQKFDSRLAFAVGKDIGGKVVVTDIAKMPHALIAGATGSGKSVCINTIIMSILYKAHPDDVKLIMIDPKVVELSVYNGIPHLLLPVVTDPKKAAAALHWGVAEMTERYNKFAEQGVRDLKGYNQKVAQMQKKGLPDAPVKMPQIVIIVDELADLMMVAPGEVEESICRLAQLARAAGIHLIIATQRPSVDVITGLIKANMPSRIAFAVSSGVDSRTILDMVGAEKLLGKGDMLFYPQGYPKPARIQGAFISDDEVEDVVTFLKDQNIITQYSPDIEKQMKEVSAGSGGVSGDTASAYDDYFVEAGRFIIEKDKASIGMLQRVFKIGFNRAARIMDQLCEAGVVGEEEGTKPRKVLMSPEQFESFVEESV